MKTNILCKEIRQVATGFIVEAQWPTGGEPGGYGEVICKDMEEVIRVLKDCQCVDVDEEIVNEEPEERTTSELLRKLETTMLLWRGPYDHRDFEEVIRRIVALLRRLYDKRCCVKAAERR